MGYHEYGLGQSRLYPPVGSFGHMTTVSAVAVTCPCQFVAIVHDQRSVTNLSLFAQALRILTVVLYTPLIVLPTNRLQQTPYV
jgi:hypothetical protein